MSLLRISALFDYRIKEGYFLYARHEHYLMGGSPE